MSKPIIVYFSDNQSASIYELTNNQFNKLQEADDWETIEKFEIKQTQISSGYAPDWLLTLADIYGFEVDSI